MTTGQRRGLSGRADTQVLLGDRVRVLELRRRWARVVVPDQPTPDDSRGYPGWVPRRQLTATPPAAAPKRATVVSRLAWLRADAAGGARVLQVSFGTSLPVLGNVGGLVKVAVPGGDVLRVRAGLVSVRGRRAAALAPTRASLVTTAKGFVGVDYLWAGRSGFGVDCSGLTSLVYRVHGLTIPRDAAPESTAGAAVPSGSVAKGDLMFYATDGLVHHVSMYVGNGRMVHSPRTGSTVGVVRTATPVFAREYVGARRFLG
jgi:cell wall-associated NlpC family hydrolase